MENHENTADGQESACSRNVTLNDFNAINLFSMTHQQGNEKPRPELDKVKTVERSTNVATTKLPPEGDADVPPAGGPTASSKLTDDEQMALYEQELKENDWGHQPC